MLVNMKSNFCFHSRDFSTSDFDPTISSPTEITCVLSWPKYGQVTPLSIRNRLVNTLLVTSRTDDVSSNVNNGASAENVQIFRNFKQLTTSSIPKKLRDNFLITEFFPLS